MHAVISNTVYPQPKARTSIRIANIALWVLQFLMAALFFWHGQLMAFPPADMVAMINAAAPKPGKRGPYRKRSS